MDKVLRRDFRLPEEDEAYLNALGFPWETLKDRETLWLLIHDHPAPDGYTIDRTIMAIRIERGYPPGMLDMVYFSPALTRKDGKPIHAETKQAIEDKAFQRWSRHYTWRDGIDSLTTHYLRINEWMKDELLRG